jgi:hypothetical protein
MGVCLERAAKELKQPIKDKPIMEIEINIDAKIVEKCLAYVGDTAEGVSRRIAKKHQLTEKERKIILKQLKLQF